jgi:hypothetical protein
VHDSQALLTRYCLLSITLKLLNLLSLAYRDASNLVNLWDARSTIASSIEQLPDAENSDAGIWADSAYRSEAIEVVLELLRATFTIGPPQSFAHRGSES